MRREIDPSTGEPAVRTVSYVEFKVQQVDGGILIEPAHVYIDPSDRDKAEMLAKSALRKAGLSDDVLVEHLAHDFATGLRMVESSQVFQRPIETRVGGHEPGLLKIAYELAWYWLGDAWSHSAEAIAMRDVLAGRTPSTPLRGKIYNDGDAAIIPLGSDPRLVHVAWLYQASENQLIVFVRIFGSYNRWFRRRGAMQVSTTFPSVMPSCRTCSDNTRRRRSRLLLGQTVWEQQRRHIPLALEVAPIFGEHTQSGRSPLHALSHATFSCARAIV